MDGGEYKRPLSWAEVQGDLPCPRASSTIARRPRPGQFGGRDRDTTHRIGPVTTALRPLSNPRCGHLRAGPLRRSGGGPTRAPGRDRKSTRLNSSHVRISYAVFCLKKKKNNYKRTLQRAAH